MQSTNKLYSLPPLAIHTLLVIFVLATSQYTHLAAQNEFLKANPAIYVSSNPSQPTVNAQWAKFAKTNSIPVQSIDPLNEDYSDLNFLKQEIGNKRIVMLGESTHGADEYSKSKVRLIKFLNKEMGFEVIAFESGMEACAATNYYRAGMTPQEMLKNALFKVWHTEANLELMNYLTIHQQIQIAGFDMQPLKVDTTYSYLQKFFQPIGIYLAQNALDAEQKFYKVYRPVNVTTQSDIADLRTQYKNLADNIQQHPDLFNTFHTQQAIQTASQIIKQRIGVLDIAARNSLGVFNPHYRDKFMAENIEWLANELYPNKKIIIWAHNAHIARQRQAINPDNNYMGELLSTKTKHESFVVGFYFYRGENIQTDRSHVFVASQPSTNSLEAILHTNQYKYSFINVSNQLREPATDWIFQPLSTFITGYIEEKRTLVMDYDAIFFIDEVTVPKYLKLEQ